VIEIDQQNIIAAINEMSERLAYLDYEAGNIRSYVDQQVDIVDRKIDNCQSLAHSAYECANVSYAYEQVLDEIVERVTDSVAERVLDRVWKMIDDAKDAPSEKEFLTGIERLLLK